MRPGDSHRLTGERESDAIGAIFYTVQLLQRGSYLGHPLQDRAIAISGTPHSLSSPLRDTIEGTLALDDWANGGAIGLQRAQNKQRENRMITFGREPAASEQRENATSLTSNPWANSRLGTKPPISARSFFVQKCTRAVFREGNLNMAFLFYFVLFLKTAGEAALDFSFARPSPPQVPPLSTASRHSVKFGEFAIF
ncbi:uncharacterized protein UTRI_06336 [Ustilago trichophora]|uniref:Uncharacterized protein n=1 Tax=Ustilago trichophora TaxID=86804 RepID=A0A5C3EL72_9BASI|nr:uncharacterized protein UTRI_06336 [Ustilago trichophora]